MNRMIKDYVEIGSHASLDALIERLTEIRDNLPPGTETELKLRGDDVFGRHLCVGYLRPLTAEEAACEGRYADAGGARRKKAA